MITVRNEFQLKFGFAKDAIVLIRELPPDLWRSRDVKWRVLTDITGPAYTLVLEGDFKDLTHMQEDMQAGSADPNWQAWYAKFKLLCESSNREIYTLLDL